MMGRKYGHLVSKETRQKISVALIGRPLSEETKLKMKGRKPWNKGKTGIYSPELLRKMSESRKGKPPHSPEFYREMGKKFKGRPKYNPGPVSEATKKKLSLAMKGKQNSLGYKLTAEHKETIRQADKRRWANEETRARYLESIFASTHRRPTKPEKQLMTILDTYFPGHFAYNGDFSKGVVLNRMVPDFVNVNGEKSVIEVFGEAFHKPEKAWKPISYKSTEEGRSQSYQDIGYRCLIVWDTDLKKPDTVMTKLRDFIRS